MTARAIFVTLVTAAVASGAAGVAGAAPDLTRAAVHYQLTGTGMAGYVTYQTDYGQSHATNVPLPWSMQVTGWMSTSTSISPHSLSAQGAGPGTLTCTIRVGDKVVSQNTAAGNPARVVCENHGQ